jgi:uncharacterized Fe-S radical SAM superfamily protein PflX
MKRLPWIMAAMWLAARFAAGKFLDIETAKNFGVLSNVLMILILIFLSIYFKYKNYTGERPSFFEDLKHCMKTAMKYVIGAVLAIALYYGVLSDDVQTIRRARIEALDKELQNEEFVNKIKSQRPEYKDMTVEQLRQTNIENVETIISVKAQISGGLLALTFVSLMYSLLAVFFWRSIVKKL